KAGAANSSSAHNSRVVQVYIRGSFTSRQSELYPIHGAFSTLNPGTSPAVFGPRIALYSADDRGGVPSVKTLVSVVIPVFNEAQNVPILLERVDAVFASMPEYDYECLFVNDGGTDETHALLESLRPQHPQLRPIHLKANRGQSAAMVAGMQRARGEYILTLDGDLQNDPADFPRFLELLQD